MQANRADRAKKARGNAPGECAIPDYSILPEDLVRNANIEMLTTRGCPYACKLCSSETQYGRKVVVRSLDSVREEL